jgi:hypothetical protein
MRLRFGMPGTTGVHPDAADLGNRRDEHPAPQALIFIEERSTLGLK